MQEEVGEEGTPHIQGFAHWKNAIALSGLKAINPRLHWEQVRSVACSVRYCTDLTKRAPGGRVWTKGYTAASVDNVDYVLEFEDLYEWQKELVTELRSEPNDRTILWYYDADGGSGKTAVARHIISNCERVHFFSGGNFRDCSFQIVKRKEDPRSVIFNFPRTCEGKISYHTLETIKDGLISTGKYEGGHRLFRPPHVVCMANFLPDLGSLTLDRWEIRHLRMNVRTI